MEWIHVDEPVLVKTSHFTERLKKRVGQERMVVLMPCDREEYHCSTVKTSDDSNGGCFQKSWRKGEGKKQNTIWTKKKKKD